MDDNAKMTLNMDELQQTPLNLHQTHNLLVEIIELCECALETHDGEWNGISPQYTMQIMTNIIEIAKTMVIPCKVVAFGWINDVVGGMYTYSDQFIKTQLDWLQAIWNLLDCIEPIQS